MLRFLYRFLHLSLLSLSRRSAFLSLTFFVSSLFGKIIIIGKDDSGNPFLDRFRHGSARGAEDYLGWQVEDELSSDRSGQLHY